MWMLRTGKCATRCKWWKVLTKNWMHYLMGLLKFLQYLFAVIRLLLFTACLLLHHVDYILESFLWVTRQWSTRRWQPLCMIKMTLFKQWGIFLDNTIAFLSSKFHQRIMTGQSLISYLCSWHLLFFMSGFSTCIIRFSQINHQKITENFFIKI